MMRFYEFVGNGLKPFIGSVRAVVQGLGSVNSKVKIEADSLMSARYALSRIYGKENVLSVQQTVTEDGGLSQPLTPEQLQVKALKDKSAQFKQQAKKTQAQQKVQKAQANLAKVSSSAVKSSMS
jgi:hypothetical protein